MIRRLRIKHLTYVLSAAIFTIAFLAIPEPASAGLESTEICLTDYKVRWLSNTCKEKEGWVCCVEEGDSIGGE